MVVVAFNLAPKIAFPSREFTLVEKYNYSHRNVFVMTKDYRLRVPDTDV